MKHRVQDVINRFNARKNHEGDTQCTLYKPKFDAVRKLICNFPAIENNYCRSKTSERVYLSSELNI